MELELGNLSVLMIHHVVMNSAWAELRTEDITSLGGNEESSRAHWEHDRRDGK